MSWFQIFQENIFWPLLPVQYNYCGEGGQAQHPEPEKDVNLFIEDVEREDAKSVMLLQLSRTTKLVKSALGQPNVNTIDTLTQI